MKRVTVNRSVRNVDEVLAALKRVGIPAISVGSDTQNTYVYLPDSCTQDPSSLIHTWNDDARVSAFLDGDNPVADGKSVARIVISYGGLLSSGKVFGLTRIRLRSKGGVKLSKKHLTINEEGGVVEVGPSTHAVEDEVEVFDPWGRIHPIRVPVWFLPCESSVAADIGETVGRVPGKGSVWGVFRRLLRKK